jgi:adenylylsulfate kinase
MDRLYKKARSGQIDDFTGISAPYEEPADPEIVLDTSQMSVGDCVDKVSSLLQSRKIF